MEESALRRQRLPSTKKALPTFAKETSVVTDSKINKKQKEYDKCDENNEKYVQ